WRGWKRTSRWTRTATWGPPWSAKRRTKSPLQLCVLPGRPPGLIDAASSGRPGWTERNGEKCCVGCVGDAKEARGRPAFDGEVGLSHLHVHGHKRKIPPTSRGEICAGHF